MIQNSSLKSARPLNFKCNPTNTQLVNFVNPSYSQAVSVNMPTLQAKTVPNFYPQTSLYDRYNRNNLYFRDCERRDIIPLTKNIVIHQEQLSEYYFHYLEIWHQKQHERLKKTKLNKLITKKLIKSLIELKKYLPKAEGSNQLQENTYRTRLCLTTKKWKNINENKRKSILAKLRGRLLKLNK